ncbi:MOSC domain-containing protein [Jannaschia sp. KMU-145]|uniref:MOSC domain-containing protein n=1 Tax=Jannaschia halovivens TaxID=3388667 RepID=UPI00396AF707
MTPTLASIWRHPIKAVGREAMDAATLTAGATLPGDRLWAVAHEASSAGDDTWSRCAAFIRAGSSPALMAIEARTEGAIVHLTHPDRSPLAVDPEAEGAALVEWLDPLVADGRARPARIVRAPAGHGMTDTSQPTISLGNLTSHRIIAQRLGRDLSLHRWRCNLWVDGLAPWEEFDLIGREFRIGAATLRATERIERCEATSANPETGRRDADLLSVLDAFGHRDFTIALAVVAGGRIAVGDAVTLP